MLRAINSQLQVVEDRTPDSVVFAQRMKIAAKFIRAANKWENTPPIGVDYPGSRHAELALSFISILQHPLLTGTSIGYTRLRYPVPKTIVYRNIVPQNTDKMLSKLAEIARPFGTIPATFRADHKDKLMDIRGMCRQREDG